MHHRLLNCHDFVVLLLVTLSYGQDDIPRFDDMNSFRGEPFTMTCPDRMSTSPFMWYVQIMSLSKLYDLNVHYSTDTGQYQ